MNKSHTHTSQTDPWAWLQNLTWSFAMKIAIQTHTHTVIRNTHTYPTEHCTHTYMNKSYIYVIIHAYITERCVGLASNFKQSLTMKIASNVYKEIEHTQADRTLTFMNKSYTHTSQKNAWAWLETRRGA
jgi:hypothetical protein